MNADTDHPCPWKPMFVTQPCLVALDIATHTNHSRKFAFIRGLVFYGTLTQIDIDKLRFFKCKI